MINKPSGVIHIGNDLPPDWENISISSIVSLVPSITELLYHLGLNNLIKGVTKFCVLPEVKSPQPVKIGGTKNPALQKIIQLRPDLIIANKEENNRKDIQALSSHAVMVWVTDIVSIDDNICFYNNLRKLFSEIISVSEDDWTVIQKKNITPAVSAAYLIWKDPWMVSGAGTFIDQMMRIAGYRNVFHDQLRYPVVTIDELIAKQPQTLLLSTEPYPFRQKHCTELSKYLPDIKCRLVDGQMFSWYGIRPLVAIPYFETF